MMRKIQLGLAAIGAFALFALALWAGGDTKLVVARDTSGVDAGRLMSQIATPFAAAKDDAATTVAQVKAPGSGNDKAAKRGAATSGNAKRKPQTRTPGSYFVDGVPRGSFDDEPQRKEDVTRGSHADGGA